MEFQVIWFVLWAVLWAVYFMLDGFVMGFGMLHNFLGKSDAEKRVLINSVGPVWDGNEVWLLTAGGATFAAFPKTYALMFSYLYTALLLLLFALIIRGVSIEFRRKGEGREQVRTRQPAAEKRLTVAWPMPRLAPVRRMVLWLPAMSRILSLSRGEGKPGRAALAPGWEPLAQ